MQILLFILKIMGIILLILLGLLLLGLVLVLFVPIRYEISGEIEDEHKIEAGGVIRYLFSIIKLTIAYRNGALETDLYLFGFRKQKSVLDEDEISSSKTNSKEAETIRDDEEIEKPDTTEEANSTKIVESEEFKAETVVNKDFDAIKETVPATEQLTTSGNSPTGQDTQPPKVKTESKKKIKTKNARQNKNDEKNFPFELIKKELTDNHNYNVLKKVLGELIYLISHFGFRKIKTNLCFGTGDPALTGQLLGILAMFPILYRYEFGIVPDFETEKAYIKGSFAITGRIRLIHVLVTAGRLIFDKEVRMVVKKFMGILNQ